MENLFTALAAAQGEMSPVAKNAKNPHFKSKYVTLDDILEMARPILNRHGLAIVQMPVFMDELCGVRTIITHKSGEQMDCGELLLPLGRGGGSQGSGSSLTYSRRYSLSAVLAISSGDPDDDGNAAQAAKPNPEHQAIQAALKAFSEEHGKDAAHALVKSLGVNKVAELPSGSLEKVTELIEEKNK